MKKILIRILYIPCIIISTIIAVLLLFSEVAFVYGIIHWIIYGDNIVDHVTDMSMFLMDKTDSMINITDQY